MIALESGTYLGKVAKLRYADGIIAGSTTYHDEVETIAPHYHENPHISFILSGGNLEKRRKSVFERLPGHIMFYHSGEVHQNIPKVFPSQNINLEIEHNFLKQNNLTESNINSTISSNLEAKFSMLKIFKEISFNDVISSSTIQMILLNLVSNTQQMTDKSNNPRWLTAIDELLNDNWNIWLTLQDLSQAAHVHPVTISRYFPKYFQCTLAEYQRKIKIEKALNLIRANKFSLTEIAFECGFSDQSHFVRTFKILTGFLPNQYQKL